MEIIKPPFQKPNIFIFTKQSNGDILAYANPSYLMNWRRTFLGTLPSRKDTKIENEVKVKLAELEQISYDLIWKALKSRLRTMTDKEKMDLLKKEWQASHLGNGNVPAQVEKNFMKEFSGKITL
uniref:Uncharacterized protein n=1 Tax=viral metagenome TaxID=1070528 RepID=A0A6H1ZKU0_9ZZZZ